MIVPATSSACQRASALRLDEAEAAAKGRPLAIHLALALLRIAEHYRVVLGSFDRTAILTAVAALQTAGSGPVRCPREASAPTLTSVAEAAGFTRETTRRKVLRLVADRILRKDANGHIEVDPGAIEQRAFADAIRRHNLEVARLINAFVDLGIVRDERDASMSGIVAGRRDSRHLQPPDPHSSAVMWPLALELLATSHRILLAHRRTMGSDDEILIQLAVVVITSQHLARDGIEDELLDLQRRLPRHRLGVSNISSLSAASGLPLETTRRKTLELIAQGTLQRDARGDVQFAPGILQQPKIYHLVLDHVAQVTALANRLLRLGTLVRAPA